MESVLVKSFSFIFIILLGFSLKSLGFFKREDGAFISKIVVNITLPALLISNASNMSLDLMSLSIILFAFISNIIIVIIAKVINRDKESMVQAIAVINTTGFNIGNFAIPFVSSFFNATAILYLCVFDIGNALVSLGGSYAYASSLIEEQKVNPFKMVIKRLFTSIPFMVYLLIFILSLLKITLPELVISTSAMVGQANVFLAMLMMGIMLEIKINKEDINATIKILFSRYLIVTILSLIVYFVLPFPLLAKKTIVLALFSPISSVATVFSLKLGSKSSVPAIVNSISLLISIAIMTLLLIVLI
jgi:Predicted permeases